MRKRIRVLIADDHDTVRSIVRTLLAIEGDFDVVAEAVNGREAIELAKIYRPDVIIMDMSMPTLDGISATREVLQILPESKVIIFSANQDPVASRVSFAAGAVGFINKPTSRKVLVTALRDAVLAKPTTVSS
jgi:DNA-binding NarL/FixJ family response regulator